MLSFAFLNAKKGDIIWSYKHEEAETNYDSSPCIYLDNVYFGAYYFKWYENSYEYGGEGFLSSINAYTGGLTWTYKSSYYGFKKPAISDSVLYCTTGGNYYDYGKLIAIGIEKGNEIWTYQGNNGYSIPLVCYGNIYCNSSEYYSQIIIALSRENGLIKWKTSIKTSRSSPVECNGNIVTGSNNILYLINPFDGSIIRTFSINENDANLDAIPCVDKNMVFTNSGKTIYAILDSDFSLIWKKSFNSEYETSPIAYNSKILLSGGKQKQFCAINENDGSDIWNFTTAGEVLSQGCIGNNNLYINCSSGYLYCLDPETGNLKWISECLDSIEATSPAFLNDIVYVCNKRGRIYALQAVDGYIKVEKPSGGELFVSGETIDIEWTSENIDSVNLLYSINNKKDFNFIKKIKNTGKTTWKIPEGICSDSCFVRVENLKRNIGDSNDYPFSIHRAKIIITAPNGGERWVWENTYDIKWDYITNISDSVKIEYTIDNGANWNEITKISNCGSFSWTVPREYGSNRCIIKISSLKYDEVIDGSDKWFSIIPPYEYFTNICAVKTPLKLILYPNPFSSRLSIETSEEMSFYSITGRLIRKIGRGTYNLDTSDWASGLYIIKTKKGILRITKL